MPARVCPTCDVAWPTQHLRCPVCKQAARYEKHIDAVTANEARSICLDAEFERVYWDRWDRGRPWEVWGKTGEGRKGPLPDVVSRAELIQEIRELPEAA